MQPTPYKRIREQLRNRSGGAHDSRLIAVIMLLSNGSRIFRTAEEGDLVSALKAERLLSKFLGESSHEVKYNLLNEPTPECRGPGAIRQFVRR